MGFSQIHLTCKQIVDRSWKNVNKCYIRFQIDGHFSKHERLCSIFPFKITVWDQNLWIQSGSLRRLGLYDPFRTLLFYLGIPPDAAAILAAAGVVRTVSHKRKVRSLRRHFDPADLASLKFIPHQRFGQVLGLYKSEHFEAFTNPMDLI